MAKPTLSELDPNEILVGDRMRPLNPDIVDGIKDSIERLGGIKTPISVRSMGDNVWELVAGFHRLRAAIELEMETVPVREETGSEIDARLWEIAENLHRSELSALERSEHIAEWIRLVDEQDISAQPAPKLGRPEGGINAAAREIGVERTEAQRAAKIDKLSPEAKAEARNLKLDDNKTALMNAAKSPTKEGQLRAMREHAASKAARKSDVTATEKRIESAVTAVKRLSQEELVVFADWFDAYRQDAGGAVFDNTSAGTALRGAA